MSQKPTQDEGRPEKPPSATGAGAQPSDAATQAGPPREAGGSQSGDVADGLTIQVVATQVGSESICFDILKVREIVRANALPITRVPNAHGYTEGVVNLRGRVVPVLHLGRRLRLRTEEQAAGRRIVIVEVAADVVGLAVDAVSEVLRLPASALEDGVPGRRGFGRVATVAERVLTVLDPEELFDLDGTAGDEESKD